MKRKGEEGGRVCEYIRTHYLLNVGLAEHLIESASLLMGVCQCLAGLPHPLVVIVDFAALKVAAVVLQGQLGLPSLLVGTTHAVVGQALLVGVTT